MLQCFGEHIRWFNAVMEGEAKWTDRTIIGINKPVFLGSTRRKICINPHRMGHPSSTREILHVSYYIWDETRYLDEERIHSA